MWRILVPLVSFVAITIAQKDPHYVGNRTTIVHLFEWKFKDIASECENFLGPMGYGGVQVSPVNENLVIKNRPWYERYQPISYKIITRSGNEQDFRDMVERCNKAGVRIYVDAVINHMSGNQSPAYGTGGTFSTPEQLSYPGVPYTSADFHRPCGISNYQNATEVRDCELSGLHDLDQSKEHVRSAIIDFFDKLVDIGIAGLRVDAAKHMSPADLKVIYGETKDLNVKQGFGKNERPFVFQEVIDLGGEGVSKFEYTSLGRVIDFTFGIVLGEMFRGMDKLARLENWGDGPAWYMPDSNDALVMIDNHDNQRGHGAGGASILTYKQPKEYKMAIAFMQAHPYGVTRVMSSFAFEDPSQGPPADANENILSPKIDENGQCSNGWVCEHRWPEVYRMVRFRNLVNGEELKNWWSNGENQIAFSRGSKGFVVFNAENTTLRETLQTGLPAGIYCDVISGSLENGDCTGKKIRVEADGTARIKIPADAKDGVIAIHVEEKV